ncbi:PD40 domain-containing protein [Oceanobacillus sp. CFH 90083]|uniref:TolB family protein n=1 Tax=Oceanobacillus sp. CFH 90083 TaxID=2592336 RepID=UPI00128AED6C|nr:PD40 domain-containing protein [Oceanobacillus sp. CFH 90083]
MSLTMKNISFIVGMILLFLILWGTGYLEGDPEGYTGFGETADISPDDEEIVFIYEHEGESAVYTAPVNGGNAELVAGASEGNSLLNPTFSPDGGKIAYVEQWEDDDEQQLGKLMLIDRADGKIKEMTGGEGLVTEAAFSPDGQSLFFLEAGVHTNYSPIASERPHEFDIYRIDLDTEEMAQITEKAAYDMSDLDLIPDGEALMYRNFDETDQLVFHNLEDGSETTVIPMGDFAVDEPIISSPALSPDGEYVAFSDVARTNENGTYIYEGYRMDLETKQVEQITSFGEHVTSPVFFNNQDKLIVTVDKGFATLEPDYSYWVISTDGEERQRIQIEIP